MKNGTKNRGNGKATKHSAKDDAAVRDWFATTLLTLAQSLVSSTASAPPAVRRRFAKPSMVDAELVKGLHAVKVGDLASFQTDFAAASYARYPAAANGTDQQLPA
jgi:hypothetical protein